MPREVIIRNRLPRDVSRLLTVALVCDLVYWIGSGHLPLGLDAHAYWRAWRGPMYTLGPGGRDAYLYSPAFAQALWPLAQLPWPIFYASVAGGSGTLLAWLLKPAGWRWGVPLWLFFSPDVISGNVNTVLAAACVVGFSWPAAWAFPALTKVVPTLGPLWFLVRREWRGLGLSLGWTAVVAAASIALGPSLWLHWLELLHAHVNESWGHVGGLPLMPPLVVRLVAGLALAVWAALRDHRWLLAVAMLLCNPVLWWGALAVLASIPRLRASQGRTPLWVLSQTPLSVKSSQPRAGTQAQAPR